jgi:hypothetical protein
LVSDFLRSAVSLWSLCRNVILRSGATKNLLFGFVENHADSIGYGKKSRSFATAQDDAEFGGEKLYVCVNFKEREH